MAVRRYGKTLQSALLNAAWAELEASGYTGMTMDAVATRAQTSRAVLYRRWADKAELTRDAVRHYFETNRLHLPDTGCLRGDLIALLSEVNNTYPNMITLVRLHLSGFRAEDSSGSNPLMSMIPEDRFEVVDEIYRRAAQRGEIDFAITTRMTRTAALSVLREMLITQAHSVPLRAIEEMVDSIALPLAGAAPSSAPGSRPDPTPPHAPTAPTV
ncbi:MULTISPECIES: TetR-like C-terminal domain-containing protein [unclassified Corynebacterium]|uniref:TetR/AcrR family transcriptional regulator n=1 Tax=unclassified Corynebacterium TaxID=2624378 RepID=UPI0029CA25AA|nr:MULTISPECIES: TetR-like C-terminal domain-containing protein [unclassified Corynebacterium]WPF65655.1 TetR-like C-terminal domain-containing protein [Corynebacterium sp. 22KM0430]WPF68151.1 TetR-like C-terminal domain-containing protein [Corynebacterium sp. 21KM1197]